MPIPKPENGESHDDFIERCMSALKEEFPNSDQRYAVCQQKWEDKNSKAIAILPQVYGRVWAIAPDGMQTILSQVDQPIRAIDYAAYRKRESTRFSNISGQVHVLPLQGVITPRASIFSMLFGGTPLDYFTEAFDSAVSNEKVGAIIIDVDSPGGSVYGVQELVDKIYNARGTKPIIASINGMGASAAYWLASAADEIVVTPSGEAGSVGVIAVHTDISGFEAKEGIKHTFITAGKYKAEGNEHEPLTDEATKAMQARVNEYYTRMVADIARNRGVDASNVISGFGEGRVYGATQAKKAGMVDKVASLDKVMRSLHPTTRKKMAAMHEQIQNIKAEANADTNKTKGEHRSSRLPSGHGFKGSEPRDNTKANGPDGDVAVSAQPES